MSGRPKSRADLTTSERRFTDEMHGLGFGRFEFLRIERGELVLDPWPTTVRGVKFGAAETTAGKPSSIEFQLKAQVKEFFEYVRSVSAGEIRSLEVRHGLPFFMEVQQDQGPETGGHD